MFTGTRPTQPEQEYLVATKDTATSAYLASAGADPRAAAFGAGYDAGYAQGKTDAAPVVTDPPTTTPTTPSTSAPTAATVTSNGRTYKRSFVEDFTTDAALGKVTSVYSKMGYYDGFGDTSGLGKYSPAKTLSVHDSALDIYVHAETVNGKSQPFGAVILPDAYAPHTYGRFSIRYKATATKGYKFVPLLWPSSDQWNDGEVDWPEEAYLGQKPRPASAVPGTYANGNMKFLPSTETFAPTDDTDWHTATTEWAPDALRFYWDDTLVATIPASQGIPTKPMRYTIQAETWIGQGAVPSGAAGHILIDWVAIYDLA